MDGFLKIADLDDDDVIRLKELEQELGLHVMAFEKGLRVADLNRNQLKKVRALEEDLGVTLLVFET